MQGKVEALPVSQITIDAATQFRVRIDEDTVKEYAGLMKDGVEFPAVTVYADVTDGGSGEASHYLAHGFHRLAAAKQAGRETIAAEVRPGTLRDAVLLALSANHDNGLTRTNDDKRKAVVFCLRDPELRAKTQREIAALCGVTQAMVSKVNAEINPKPKGELDNGYQMPDTPEAALALLTDEQKTRLVEAQPSGGRWFNAVDAKAFERAGLITRYSDRNEWTPLAQEAVTALVAADPLLALERALLEWNRTRPEGERAYVSGAGQVRPVLEKLYNDGKPGWVDDDEVSWYGQKWLELIREAPLSQDVVKRHIIESEAYGEATFWHILRKGCELLGRDELPIAPQPTLAAYEAAERDRRDAQQQDSARREAERLAALDPAKEAARARENILWHLRSVTGALESARFLDTETARRVAAQLRSIVESAPVVDRRVQAEPVSEAQAVVDSLNAMGFDVTLVEPVAVPLEAGDADMIDPPGVNHPDQYDEDDCDAEAYGEDPDTIVAEVAAMSDAATEPAHLLPMERDLLAKARACRDGSMNGWGEWFSPHTPGFEETPHSLLDVLTARGLLERQERALSEMVWRISEAGMKAVDAAVEQPENEGESQPSVGHDADDAPPAEPTLLPDQPEIPYAKHSHVWHKKLKRVGKVFGSMDASDGIVVMVSDPTRPDTQPLQGWKLEEVRAATADEVWLMTAREPETAI